MGLCINCKYHQFTEESKRFRSEHICTNADYMETDFVTGDTKFANCYLKNGFEECLKFEALESEVTDDTEASEDTNTDTGTTTDDENTETNTDTGTDNTGDNASDSDTDSESSGDSSDTEPENTEVTGD